jgi:hypothetical protein
MKFQEIITEINNAFFRLESFMNGSIRNYQYFGFNEAFTSLFSEAKKPENFTYNNCKLIGKYWDLIEQIRVDYDRSDFKYTEAYENENFCKDCDEIMYVNWDRIEEFMVFSTPDEIAEAERKFSITDILKAPTLPPQPIAKQNDKLSDLITHQKSVEIVEGIKIRYKNIKGKRLKLLLLALQELNLLPKERIAKKFYNCCKAEFGWDVASYTAMNDYQINEYTDEFELDNMKKFLEEIIQTK